jgi:hypothetical protein
MLEAESEGDRPAATDTIGETERSLMDASSGDYGIATDPERVAAVRATGLLDSAPQRRFDRITELARSIFAVRNAQVTLLDDTRQFIKSHAGLSDLVGGSSPLNDAICTTTIQGPHTFVVEDARADDRFKAMTPVLNEPSIRFYAGYPISSPSGQRIGALCIFDDHPRSLTADEDRVLKELALFAEKEIADGEDIVRAVEVQRSLLPRSLPDLAGYRIAGDCLPARGIGGDFFDWRVTGDTLQVTLADVMGKGIGAALIAASVRAVMLATASRSSLSDSFVFAGEALAQDLEAIGIFVTVFGARLDLTTGVLTWIDAGHGLAVILRADGTRERLVSEDRPLGLFNDGSFRERQIQLEPGDRLVLPSDGVLDLFDGTLASLDSVADAIAPLPDPSAAVNRVIHGIERSEAADDVSLVVLQRDL